MRTGETYPKPDPLCSSCNKPVRFMQRMRCRTCKRWCHGSCAPIPRTRRLGGICFDCRGIPRDENGKAYATPELARDLCFQLCDACGITDQEDARIALILFMAAFVSGADEWRIAQDTGFDVDYVNQIGCRLRDSKIWVSDKVDAEWDDETQDAITTMTIFSLHVAVGRGVIVRRFDSDASADQNTPSGNPG